MLRYLVLPLALAFPLLAGPRQPRMPLEPRPAVYVQVQPDVATDGRDFIAVWADERSKDRPNFTRGFSVFATRLGTQGQALDPFGIEIAPIGSEPQIEWNGRTYLVTYNAGLKGYARRLGTDGRPTDVPKVISNLPIYDLATDGSTFCAFTFNYPDSAIVLVDENANVLRRIPVEGPSGAVVSVGRNYVVFTVSGTSLLATTLSPNGSLSQKTIATVPAGSLVNAHSNGSRVAVTWTSLTSTSVAVLDEQMTLVAHPLHFSSFAAMSYAGPASVVWDGVTFLVTWPESSDRMSGARIGTNGGVIGTAPFALEVAPTSFQSATNGVRTLLVSSEQVSEALDPVARAMSSFDALLPEPRVISFTGTPHSEPDVAAMGNLVMAVVREGESYGGIAASLFKPGQPGESRISLEAQQWGVTRDAPAVAAGGDTFLVSWREVTDWTTRILAKRVLATGAVLDSEPIVVADEGRFLQHFADTAVAWNGESFLVVWHSVDDEIRARVVERDGRTAAAVTVSTDNGNPGKRTPAVVWNGSSYFVVWSETKPLIGNISPANPLHTVYRSAHVSRDANVLGEPETLFEEIGNSQGLALAANRENILLITTTGSYLAGADWPVHSLFFDIGGNPLSAAPTRVDTQTPTFRRMHPAAAWTGTSFAVFWNERPWLDEWSVVEGRSLSRSGAMTTLGLDRAPSFFPAAATYAEGVVLVETAALLEQANMARLYSQTFAPVRKKMRAMRP